MDTFVTRRKRVADKDDSDDNKKEISIKKSKVSSKSDDIKDKNVKLSQQETPQSSNVSKQESMLENPSTQDEQDGVKTESADDKLPWRRIRGENLNCDYGVLYMKAEADRLQRECEDTLTYNTGKMSRVQVFGKWRDIPRQQVAHGDEGLSYSFSKNTVPARPWIPLLERVRDRITAVTGYTFNFVLINRYKDGCDHIGEHRDDEKDLVPGHPIASLSLGQARDFVFKHASARGKNATCKISPVKIELQHGNILLMKYPTNRYWYHSLPPRKKLTNVRINMTFRKMVVQGESSN